MKLKRFLALVVSLAMVLSIVPAFSLTASAATNTYNATAFGHSGSASGTGVFIGTSSTGTSGNKDGAPYINGTTTNKSGAGLGSSRIGYISFSVPKPAAGEEVTSATMKLYVTGVNGNLGTSWMKMAAYRTTGTPSSVSIGSMNGDQYLAVNNDYSYNAGYWTNEQISSSNLGWKTIDVTKALNDAIAEATGDTVTLSFRLLTPTAGLNVTTASTNAANQPVLEVNTAKKVNVTVNYVNANGQLLATRTETAYTGDEFTVTKTVNDNYLIVDKTETEDGYVFDLIDSDTITVAESDNVVNVTVNTVYLIKSANLLPDGEDGLDSWTVGTSNGDNFATQPISGSSNTVTKSSDRAHTGQYSIKTASGWNSGTVNGWRGHTSIALYADVNPNSMYYFAGSVYMGNAAGTEATIATLTEAGNPLTMQGLTNGVKELSNGGITSYNGTSTGDGAGNGKLFTNMNGRWNQLEYVLTTDENSKGFAALLYYLLDAGTSYFDDFMLYEIEVPATSKEIVATYKVGDRVLKTETKIIDTTATDSATFGELRYTENGVNAIYYTEGATLTESGDIALTALENPGTLNIGDKITADGVQYKITSANLVPNGDFSLGLEGWYGANNGDLNTGNFTVNADGTVTSKESKGTSDAGSLHRAWAIENGKTYVFTVYDSADHGYHAFSLTNTICEETSVLLGKDAKGPKNNGIGTTYHAFTNSGNYAYAQIKYRWTTDTFGNFGLYEVEEVIETTAGTVKAGMDSLSLPLATKTSITVPTTSTDAYGYESTVTWTSSNTDVLAIDGTVTSPEDITIVTLTPSTTFDGVTVTGNVHTIYVFPASVAGTEFNSGSGYYDIGTTNLISFQGTNASFENQSLAGWMAHTGQETNGAMIWVNSANAVVPDGEWAYASRWSDPITGSNYCTIDTMWEVEAGTYYLSFYAKKANGADGQVYVYYSADNAHHTAVDQLTSEAWYEKVTLTDDWKKYEYIVTADAAGYIGFTGFNLGTTEAGGTHLDDFELYTAVQAAEDLVSVETPATVTVIAGNEPVLPATVVGVGERGSHMEVDVEWNDADFSAAGDVTVTGTAAGFPVSMTVTVLPQTFTVDNANSPTTVNFPTDVTGDFYVEFDLLASNYDNLWIYLSKDGNLWGAGQIGLGFDNAGDGGFKAQPQADTIISTFVTNRTYRFLVHGNVDTDTYDLVVYDTVTKEVVATVDDYGFRSASDAINSIAFTPNGEGGKGTLSNIKVYAPDQADLFKAYTVVVTGSVTDEFTETATSAEGVSIPYYEGNIVKSREVDGTTVTLTYEETKTTLGSWAIRNNVTENSWLTEMKYLGTHDSFADTDEVFRNDGGALYGDTGATSTSSTVVNQSQAQTYGALDQLNMGVRYFDIRLSRQNDGSFATVHGPAFENFRDVAATIAQFAKENPGEVILLDFQTVRDALYTEDKIGTDTNKFGPDPGDDNQYVYDALVQLLTETGVMEFAAPANDWDKHYGEITNNGEKSVILLIGKNRAYNCNNIFICRNCNNHSAIGGTYDSDISSYSGVVSNIETKIAAGAFGSGARFGVVHAYTTPGGIGLLTDSVIGMANENNPKWINENLDAWMASGYGDVFLINNVTPEIAEMYLAQMSEYNRDDFDDIYSKNADGVEINGVKLYAPTASVPFSTELTVDKTESAEVVTIDGVEYTYNAIYNIQLMQFDEVSVQPTGNVTLTFPKVSADATTVDVLIYNGEVVYTAGEGANVYETNVLGEYTLATMVAPGREYTVNYVANGDTIYTTTEMVPFGQVVYSVPAGNFYLATNGKAYILNSAEAGSHKAAASDETTVFNVELTVASENAVLADTFANNDGSADCNNTDNLLFVGSSGISDPGNTDADNVATMSRAENNVGSPRIPVLTFNVPSVAEGKAVKLNLYVAKANQNLGNSSMKLAVGTADLVVDEALGYKAADVVNTENIVWSDQMFEAVGDNIDGKFDVNSWVTVDVTEFVKAATSDTITFTLYAPTAGAYVADREKAVLGGQYEGCAAYLEVVDAYTINVLSGTKVTKMGTEVKDITSVVVPVGSTIKLYNEAEGIVAYTDGTQVYAANEIVAPEASGEIVPVTLGLTSVTGAQVRIGDGVDAEGKVSDTSGLRFITTVDYTDTLAFIDGAEIGVEITAESSDRVEKVLATQFQDDDKTVFTTALTKLAPNNYNRRYTATPYVTVDGQTFYGTPITRSIYQVAAGLLANDNDGTEYPDMADTTRLYNVLNAYVNQTGIRLSISDNQLIARTEGSGAYSGNAFFEVGETTVEGTKYTVTLTLVGDKTEIKDYWKEYVRINNNNSSVKVATELVANEDGTYTLTFDTANLG